MHVVLLDERALSLPLPNCLEMSLPITNAMPGPLASGAPAGAGLPWLLADIGGTNARFGWLGDAGGDVRHVRSLPVAAFDGPAQAAAAYLDEIRSEVPELAAPRRAAFALATPVVGDDVRMTNSHWHFQRGAAQAALGLQGLLLLNDFEALALALPHLQPAQLRPHGRLPERRGTLAVIGPGTGLGVGAVVETASGWVALPGEGGHATLAASDDFESDLLAWVRRSHAHVSAERLLSGMGLPLLRDAVAAVTGRGVEAPMPVEAIVERGVAGTDALCAQTLDVFCALLGGFAGNVALTLGARGGVYIGGGIVPRLGERFFASAFRERFEAKGRFHAYLSEVPTAVITDTLAALTGAAAALAQPTAR
jgi:glucokinase